MSLDPSAFVDTAGWAGELGMHPPPQPAHPFKRPTKPPATKRTGAPSTPPGEVESLEQMLEPDRTGVHGKTHKGPPWVLIVIVMIVLAAGAAAAVVFAMQ